MKSPLYWNASLYEFLKRNIFRKQDAQCVHRMAAVSAWVPEQATVLDVAAGTARLYRDQLQGHIASYTAVEINPTFVRYLQKQGIETIEADIRCDPIPEADVVVMLAALYHFKDQESAIIGKLLQAARQHVIIIEPVGQPKSPTSWRGRLNARLADIGEGPIYHRYGKEQLIEFCQERSKILHQQDLPDNECLIVFAG